MLAEMGLDAADRTIVSTIVYVAERRVASYLSELLLPAEFYRALNAKDTENSLFFRPTDEQLLAGFLLYQGNIVEMNAGEGKTMAAAFPAVLHTVLGRNVHVITANDYLASRDAEWLSPVYESLGLDVRAVLSHMSDAERSEAYRGRIVYGTLREFGFDFLRDNLRNSADELVQGSLEVAIVDEADQALVDEARTPLIIAGGDAGHARSPHKIRDAVEGLVERQKEVVSGLEQKVRDEGLSTKDRVSILAGLLVADPDSAELVRHMATSSRLRRRVQAKADDILTEEPWRPLEGDLYYLVDARLEQVTLTDAGCEYLEGRLGSILETTDPHVGPGFEERRESSLSLSERRRRQVLQNRQVSRRRNQLNLVHQMLRACILLRRDIDYIVSDGEVVLIDRVTGRRRPDSRYQHGLEVALESKERVTVHPELDVLAQISVQGFINQYSQLAGMTGTAVSARDEFRHIYGGKNVVAVPPTHPSRRQDLSARLYPTRTKKLTAVLEEIRQCQLVGRPVLVGAQTVDQSREISRLLDRHGVRHRLLNAINNADEADVVNAAGNLGAVTVATNMAGRGTDILLEPGLDRRITQRCVAVVCELLSQDATQVMLSCDSVEDADGLAAALSSAEGLSIETARLDGQIQVRVQSDRAADRGEKTVFMAFGLGLRVIGTEMSDSRRVDRQLIGRVGRRGEKGSSQFILSAEDQALVHGTGTVPAVSAERMQDVSGNDFRQGTRTERRLRAAQGLAEMEDEVGRAVTWDYSQVIERQTLAYYRARRDTLGAHSIHADCVTHMGERARALVDQYLPMALIGRYADQFERLAEELWLDFGVDCGPLFGLGVDALKKALAQLMIARLEETRSEWSEREFDRVEKLLYLQTCDELWVGHLSNLQDFMLSNQLCARAHRSAVAEFMVDSVDTGRRFWAEVADAFLPRLVAFEAPPVAETHAQKEAVAEEFEHILV